MAKDQPSPLAKLRQRIAAKAPWYALSLISHAVLLTCLTLAGGYDAPQVQGHAPTFETVIIEDLDDPRIPQPALGCPSGPIDPIVLQPELFIPPEPPVIEALLLVEGPTDEAPADGPAAGAEWDGQSFGSFEALGVGGIGSSIQGRKGGPPSSGPSADEAAIPNRLAPPSRENERAIVAAIDWLARHQNLDGSWSIDYQPRCKDLTCGKGGSEKADAAATALALLPILAAGQIHNKKGPYQKCLAEGIDWLIQQQKENGDLSGGSSHTMYSHGLATVVLCEAYHLSQDQQLAEPAQKAVDFIEQGQDPQTGGWWYKWQQRGGDTSVFGWQMTSLKSAELAGLKINPEALARGQTWLDGVAHGEQRGKFSYLPETGPTVSMTAVGLLCRQYLGMKNDNPALQEGLKFLLANPPDPRQRNVYHWYYATQVLHNVSGPQWDEWNWKMRRMLVASQIHEGWGCAEGSWDPAKPTSVAFGEQGGRLFTTSLSTLTLEIYYRYLPLYQLDHPAPGIEPAPAPEQ